MAKIQIYSLFTEEYGKNLSPKYQYNPNPRFYTPLYRLLTYNHRAMHPRLFSLYETVFATEQSLLYILYTNTYNRYPTDLWRICCANTHQSPYKYSCPSNGQFLYGSIHFYLHNRITANGGSASSSVSNRFQLCFSYKYRCCLSCLNINKKNYQPL